MRLFEFIHMFKPANHSGFFYNLTPKNMTNETHQADPDNAAVDPFSDGLPSPLEGGDPNNETKRWEEALEQDLARLEKALAERNRATAALNDGASSIEGQPFRDEFTQWCDFLEEKEELAA